MRRSARARLSALGLALGVLGLGAAAPPAVASTYTLTLSAPATAVVGQPIVIAASGVNPPPDQYWTMSWIELVSIPGSVMTTCPAGTESGASVAVGTGGQIIEIALRPNLDAAGNFVNLIGWSPRMSGTTLLCGYSDDGAGLALATASATIDVQGAPPPAPAAAPAPAGPSPAAAAAAKPANIERPRVTRSAGRLTCSTGRWSNGASAYIYGWLLGSKQMKNATGRKLWLTRAMRGRKVRCSVTASNAAGAATAVSRPLRIR